MQGRWPWGFRGRSFAATHCRRAPRDDRHGAIGAVNFPDPVAVVYRFARLTLSLNLAEWCGREPSFRHFRRTMCMHFRFIRNKKMIGLRRSSLLVLLTAFAVTAAFAQEHAGHPGRAEQGRQEQNGPGVLSLLPSDSVTEHS